VEVRSLAGSARYSPEKMQKASLFESPRMFCDVYGLEAGQAQKAHVHEGSDKIYVVLEGEGRFRVGAEERCIGAGNAVYVPPGAEHGVANDGPGRLALLVFMAPRP
jgi:mannose-6-phosphate isomerase-like protein (cupin superfamily)